MENGGSSNTNQKDDPKRDSDNQHEEKASLLTDSLYDGPLNHIIRRHPKLFVRPRYWTKRHAKFLRVVCKEERLLFWSLRPPGTQQGGEIFIQRIYKPDHEVQDAWKLKRHASHPADSATDVLRLPTFRFPSLPHPHLNSYIATLRTESADADHFLRWEAMRNLLIWQKPKPSNIWRTLLNPDPVNPNLTKSSSYQNEDILKEAYHRLKVKSIPLLLRYGKRRIGVALSCQIYSLAGDTPYTQKDAWRLIYLDCSQLGDSRQLSKRERRRRRMAERLGIEISFIPSSDDSSSDERDAWPLNQGYMASLFIAMAQERQSEAEYRHEREKLAGLSASGMPGAAEEPHAPSYSTQQPQSQPQPQLPPRYQILLTNNDEGSSCIHLYTAHVSDFLLEHFRTPSRFPHIPPPKHNNPYLLKIHRTMIPFTPYKSFRRRLRIAIMEYANGTAGGFFTNPDQGQTPTSSSSKYDANIIDSAKLAVREGRMGEMPKLGCVVV